MIYWGAFSHHFVLGNNMDKRASLTPNVLYVLKDKGTEPAFSGDFIEAKDIQGTFICRGCGQALFRANAQFTSQCGWPSFDDHIEGTVKNTPDADGRRHEIVCTQCDGHLGHVFEGEHYTDKNTRHCVNALAIEFIDDQAVMHTEEIILAAGCFWGVQHLLDAQDGVLKTEVGYIGGDTLKPTYETVCTKATGHTEAVRVVFDPTKITLKSVLQCFFEIHDFSQEDGQGPDLGPQYVSAIFYYNEVQQQTAQNLIDILKSKGHSVATALKPMAVFWVGEGLHQHYYDKQGAKPYCHIRKNLAF
jgi:peptide methionine sulfoxide reductase msrA/msrB